MELQVKPNSNTNVGTSRILWTYVLGHIPKLAQAWGIRHTWLNLDCCEEKVFNVSSSACRYVLKFSYRDFTIFMMVDHLLDIIILVRHFYIFT